MAREKSKQASLLILTLLAGLLFQSLVIPVISTSSFVDQKTYYPPDPHAGRSPHRGSHHAPSHGSGTPAHGGGSSSHGSSPPSYCGTPASGGHYDPAPTPPTTGGSPPIVTPSTPSTPTYGSPPSIISPPTSPSIDPGTPSTPTYGTPPTIISPPTSPSIDPGTPIFPVTPTIPRISVPSPPFAFDPNSPPFPCIYWLTHPTLIWGIFGFGGATFGRAFGLTSSGTPGIGPHLSLEQALSNTRTDGIGALYREGTASLLNSMVMKRFPFTAEQVRDRFVSSLGSNNAAAAQARVFKMANEGQLKPRT